MIKFSVNREGLRKQSKALMLEGIYAFSCSPALEFLKTVHLVLLYH